MYKVVVLLFFACLSAFSQTTDLDRMKAALGEKTGKERVDVLSKISFAYWKMSPEKGIEYGNEALQLAKTLRYKEGEANALNSLGVNYWSIMDLEKALSYFQESMILRELADDKVGISKSVNNIGMIYGELENYEASLQYFKRALDLLIELDELDKVAYCYNNIGEVYSKMGNFEKGFANLNKALKLKRELKDVQGVASTLANIGVAHTEMGAYEKAKDDFEQALSTLKKSGNAKMLVFPMTQLGGLYIRMKNFEKAEQYLNEAMEVAEAEGSRTGLRDVHRLLAMLYEAQHDYKRALESQKLFMKYKDELFNADNQKRMANLQIKYATYQKNVEIKLLKQTEQSQRLLLMIAIVTGVSFLILAIILSVLYKTKKHAAKVMEELSREDALTGLLNRRGMNESIQAEVVRLKRKWHPVTFTMCDIDKFKRINDKYGHKCGDMVLKTVSRIIRTVTREQDIVARWGGEEFLLMLPQTDLSGAIVAVEKLRTAIESEQMVYGKHLVNVTMSFGIQTLKQIGRVEQTIAEADEALYAAKHSGRNCVRSYPIGKASASGKIENA